MNSLDLLRIPGRSGWAIIAALIAVVLILATCTYAGMQRRAAQEARGAAGMATGRTQAAQDASGIRDLSDARQTETDTIVQGGTDAIRNAPDRAAASDAARRSVCVLSGCADPGCTLLDPDPCRVD